MRITILPTLMVSGLGVLLLAGCLDTGGEASQGEGNRAAENGRPSPVNVAFDPANQVLPFPTNLMFEADADAPLDGTVNVPLEDPEASSAALILGLNELDGFSTQAPWRMTFTGPVDPDTLVAGGTVRVFRMITEGGAYPDRVYPVAVDRELIPEEEYRVRYSSAANELLIIPAQPLDFGTTYTAVIERGVRDPQGALVGSPLQWSLARGTSLLDQCDAAERSDAALLQCTTNPVIAPLEEDGRFMIGREDMLLAWGVSTQQADPTIPALTAAVRQGQFVQPAAGVECTSVICLLDVASLPGQDVPKAPGDKALVWPGTIALPSFLETPPEIDVWGDTPSQDTTIKQALWQCDAGSCNSDVARGIDGDAQLPGLKGWHTVPVVLAAPDPDAPGVPAPPADGYPLVIFQHAIQQDRSNALALASALAEKGFAVIALDMPLHGLVRNQLPVDDPRFGLHAAELNDQLYNSTLSLARDIIPLMVERTYYLDLVDTEGESVSDGVIDGSGAHFLNPSQPLSQRDVIRQGAVDLVVLENYLRTADVQQCGLSSFLGKRCDSSGDASGFDIGLFEHVNFDQLHFVGHSVGNLVGAPFLAETPEIRTVSMLTPLGGVMETLAHSDTIGPKLAEGLAGSGVFPGTENYFRFFAIVQAAVDSIDPLNYAQSIANSEDEVSGEPVPRPVYLSQVVGNNGAEPSPADLVLPPEAGENAPLAGSTPLARAMGLRFVAESNLDDGVVTPPMNEDGTTPDILQIAVPFLYGAHSSPLRADTQVEDPRSDEPAMVSLPNGETVHFEMQQQLSAFLMDPSQLLIDPDLVQSAQ